MAEGDVFFTGAEVVVLLGHAEAGLAGRGDLLAGVLEVLLLAVAEEDINAETLEAADERGQAELGEGTVAEASRSP